MQNISHVKFKFVKKSRASAAAPGAQKRSRTVAGQVQAPECSEAGCPQWLPAAVAKPTMSSFITAAIAKASGCCAGAIVTWVCFLC